MTAEPILLERKNIDTNQWDALIGSSVNRIVYGYSWYLDAVAPGWTALVWPTEQHYEVVLPCPVKKRLGIAAVQQPFFCQYLGWFSANEISPEIATLFLKSLGSRYKYISKYSFHPAYTGLLYECLPHFPGFKVDEESTHWLALGKPYEMIRKSFSEDRLMNLRRASRHQWKLLKSADPEPIIKLFKENHAKQIQGGVAEMAYQRLRKIFIALSQKHKAEIFYASLGDRLHAGILLACDSGHVIYLFNAADEAGRKGNARTFLIDEFLRANAENESYFDFESPEKASIAAHYRSYGAEMVPFLSISANFLPFPFNHFQRLRITLAERRKH